MTEPAPGVDLAGHAHWAMAVGEVDGRPVAVTGGWDHTVRVWDLRTGTPLGRPLVGHTGGVVAVAVGELDGRPVVITGGWDQTVQVWDLRFRRVHTIDLSAPIKVIAYLPSSRILIATSRGLVLLQLMRHGWESYDIGL